MILISQGVIKTYKLTYESIEVMHAVFNKGAAKNKWTIGANVLRSFIEYFGATTEQLDLYTENGRAIFTSYTEKVMDGRGPFNIIYTTHYIIETYGLQRS